MSGEFPLNRPATAADLRRLSADVAAEVIGGVVVHKALPSFRHGTTQGAISGQVGWRFGGGGDGPGGWWIATVVEVEYEQSEVYRHDLVGWRRDRVPSPPEDLPVRICPDWVCEVLSPSNWTNDTVKKFRVLQRAAVSHYWIADVEHGAITIHEWSEGSYRTAVVAERGERVRLPPFDAVELDVGVLLRGEATPPVP